MKLASKGFEQNLQRHKESEKYNPIIKGVQKFKFVTFVMSPSAAVSGRIRPSWQCEHFMAEKYVPNSVTSEHRGHLQTQFFFWN